MTDSNMGIINWLNTEDERRDAAVLLMPRLDYESQLIAVVGLLDSHRQAEKKIEARIKKMESLARRTPGEHAVDMWIEKVHQSIYQDAAHSMAAVGMIAPLIESVFDHTFQEIGRLAIGLPPLTTHYRLQNVKRETWDCHWVLNKDGKWSPSLVKGMVQLLDAIDLKAHLPEALAEKLAPTLSALFAYRNKMFHCGFEWPVKEREKFQAELSASGWPTDWFSKSETDNRPWMFYMSQTFIDHCLTMSGEIIGAIGGFCLERANDGSLPVGGSEPMPAWMKEIEDLS